MDDERVIVRKGLWAMGGVGGVGGGVALIIICHQ